MIKEDLAKSIALKTNLQLKQARVITSLILEQFRQALVEDCKLVILNFGTFTRKKKKNRPGRNPKTGELYDISTRHTITFKPCKLFIAETSDKA